MSDCYAHALIYCKMILFCAEAIPIPPEQPIMQIKDLDDVVIPTMDIKVTNVFLFLSEKPVHFVMWLLKLVVYVDISFRWIHQADMKTL